MVKTKPESWYDVLKPEYKGKVGMTESLNNILLASVIVNKGVEIPSMITKEQLTRIVDVQLDHLRKRLATRNLKLQISEAAKRLLAEEGYDPNFGARPLKRVIQHRLENPIASSILRGEYGDCIGWGGH